MAAHYRDGPNKELDNMDRTLIIAGLNHMPAGDIARQAAAAPPIPRISPAPAIVPPAHDEKAAKVNRFDKLFPRVLYSSPSAAAKTYGEADRKSKKLLNVLVEIADSGVFIRASLKAVQSAGEKKAHAEFTFMGTQYQSCLQCEDEQAKSELQSWKAAAVRAGKLYLQANPPAAAADAPDVEELDMTL